MKNMTLENITMATGGIYVGDPNKLTACIKGAVMDSRQVEDGYLFFPIKGERVDGHDFIPSVFEKGALATLSEKDLENPAGPYIKVESTTEAMKKLARFYRDQLSCKVVGITGSVGKTSTKEMIASVLEQKYNVLKTAGNFNNEIGLPLTIFRIRDEHEVAVLEMGISDFGEMDRLSTMANPDICVITNIGLCHLENLGTRDGILKAKTECFDHMKEDGVAILNGDDDKLITKKLVNGKETRFYGKDDSFAVWVSDIKNHGFEGMEATLHTSLGEIDAKITIPGEHNVYNAMAACQVAIELGLTKAEIEKGIASAKTIAGRTNFIHANDMIVIDDCYNANPVSMNASIEVLSHATGRSVAVLGDMGELGTEEEKLHYSVGTCVGENNIHALFCAGTLAKQYADAAKAANPDCEVYYFEQKEPMMEKLLAYVKPGDNVLVKASHFMDFPKVVEALTKTC